MIGAEEARRLLEAAAAHDGLQTADDALMAVQSDHAQLWAGKRSVVVTRVNDFTRARLATIWLAGGDMDELVGTMLPQIETWARENGCSELALAGRKGWQRVMGAQGFRTQAYVMRKPL
jgi:hypothetical protein